MMQNLPGLFWINVEAREICLRGAVDTYQNCNILQYLQVGVHGAIKLFELEV